MTRTLVSAIIRVTERRPSRSCWPLPLSNRSADDGRRRSVTSVRRPHTALRAVAGNCTRRHEHQDSSRLQVLRLLPNDRSASASSKVIERPRKRRRERFVSPRRRTARCKPTDRRRPTQLGSRLPRVRGR